MITVQEFLNRVIENEARVTHYESGGDGSKNGACDCIGLIIGALRLAGVGWNATHGSNWAARNALQEAGPSTIRSVSDLEAGMVVFKGRRPEDPNYKLPEHYQNSGDLTDYYHVGVVTGVEPLEITHCTGVAGGIKRDTKQGAWKYGGKIKYVDYEADDGEPDEPIECHWATVYADNGKPVNMRKSPSTKSAIIAQLMVGEEVEMVRAVNDDWLQVVFGGKTGYIMRKYILMDDPIQPEPVGDTVTISRTKLKELKACLSDALNVIEQALKQ